MLLKNMKPQLELLDQEEMLLQNMFTEINLMRGQQDLLTQTNNKQHDEIIAIGEINRQITMDQQNSIKSRCHLEEQLSERCRKVNDLENNLRLLNQDLSRCRLELKVCVNKIEDNEICAQAKLTEIESLQRALDLRNVATEQNSAELQLRTKELADCQASLSRLSEENSDCKIQLAHMTSSVTVSEERLALKTLENETCENQLSKTLSELENCRAVLDSKQQELIKACEGSEITTQTQRIVETLQDRLAATENDFCQAKQRAMELEEACAEYQQEQIRLNEIATTSQDTCKGLRLEVETLKEATRRLSDTNDEVATRMKEEIAKCKFVTEQARTAVAQDAAHKRALLVSDFKAKLETMSSRIMELESDASGLAQEMLKSQNTSETSSLVSRIDSLESSIFEMHGHIPEKLCDHAQAITELHSAIDNIRSRSLGHANQAFERLRELLMEF